MTKNAKVQQNLLWLQKLMLNAKHCAKLKRLGMCLVLLEKTMLLIAMVTNIKMITLNAKFWLVLLQ